MQVLYMHAHLPVIACYLHRGNSCISFSLLAVQQEIGLPALLMHDHTFMYVHTIMHVPAPSCMLS